MNNHEYHPFFRNSQCLNSYLHRFEIHDEYSDGVLEVCAICKTRKFFKIIMDRVDNAEYMSWHFRNALPPNHPFYYHEHEYSPLEEEKIISPYVNE